MGRGAIVKTPVWVKLALFAVAVAAISWWVVDRQDRRGNENRLSAVASAISGHDVQVRCPGPLSRVFGYETVDGSVRFDARGRPAHDTKLSSRPCAELDALAEGRSSKALLCVESGGGCGTEVAGLARAVDTLAHESWHLAGISDEGETECRALQTMAWTAHRLGASEAQGEALAKYQLLNFYPRMPERYRSSECGNGHRFDLHPESSSWP